MSYFDKLSKVKYFLFLNGNKIKKSFKKSSFFLSGPAFTPLFRLLVTKPLIVCNLIVVDHLGFLVDKVFWRTIKIFVEKEYAAKKNLRKI